MSTVVKMLEGEIAPWTPVDPFPYYESPSESRTRRGRHGSTRMVSPAYDERLHGNVPVSSHGSSSKARQPESIQGPFPKIPIVLDQRNMDQIQNYERLTTSEARGPMQGLLRKIPILNRQWLKTMKRLRHVQWQNNEALAAPTKATLTFG